MQIHSHSAHLQIHHPTQLPNTPFFFTFKSLVCWYHPLFSLIPPLILTLSLYPLLAIDLILLISAFYLLLSCCWFVLAIFLFQFIFPFIFRYVVLRNQDYHSCKCLFLILLIFHSTMRSTSSSTISPSLPVPYTLLTSQIHRPSCSSIYYSSCLPILAPFKPPIHHLF